MVLLPFTRAPIFLPFSQKLSIRARARPRQQGFQLGLENKTHTHTHTVKNRPTHFYKPVVLQVLPKKSKNDLYAVIRSVIIIR